METENNINVDLSKLNDEDLKKAKSILNIIDKRKKEYWITTLDLTKIPQQEELFNYYKNRLNIPISSWCLGLLYYGWNWSWKTQIGSHITTRLALWTLSSKFNLDYIGSKKLIWIGTESWANVKGSIEPYLLWEYSKSRIPSEVIEKINYDNTILKSIFLKNWTKIMIYTYDQGYEKWQGWNPDFIWLDEEPVDSRICTEILARLRNKWSELLVTMTPLNWKNRIYDIFFKENWEATENNKVIYVNSMDNPFTDKRWIETLTPEEVKLRVDWTFSSPNWLVYSYFNRDCIVPYIEPTTNNLGCNELYYYRSMDFWTSHPTWVLFICVDEDENIYIYDEIYESNMLLIDIAKKIQSKSWNYKFKYTLWDTAGKRERLEFGHILGETITPADKNSKGENQTSNRKGGILKLNNLLYNRKVFISNRCKNLIYEFENHYYKNWGKDWEVIKEKDDLLDALRYFIFNYKSPKIETRKEKSFKEKWKISQRELKQKRLKKRI
jgi:phage terminase large subunit-like protein